MRKLRIGILSDSPFLVTGYATISSNIANILAKRGHEVFFFANNYVGQTLVPGCTFEDGRKLDFTIIGTGREPYFKDLLPIYTKLYKLDVLFILFDTFMLYPWLINMDLSPAKTIFYYPTDGGGGMPLGCEQILKKMDLAICMSKFGQKQVKLAHNLDTDYIPHAVDIRNYFPMTKEQKDELRKKWALEGKFVVGTVARNQGRKFMDRTLKVFALFAKNHPNAILLMHTDPDDNAQVFHMGALINKLGIQNRVIFSGMKFYRGFEYKRMNEVYNLMDVFLLTTSGEGFGVPTIEAMACEVPVLITDYTTSRELVKDTDSGLMINLLGMSSEENPDVHVNEILDGTIMGTWNVERGICSVVDGANKLSYLFDNPNKRIEFGKNGRNAILADYNWDIIGNKFVERIEKLGGQY